MPPIISNDPGWVWFALLLFYAFGLAILAKGLEAGSPGATTIGSMLLLGGIYYSVQWFMAKRK